MTFYHGTTLEAAQQIQKQGLIPRISRYELQDPDTGELIENRAAETRPYVYLTRDTYVAKQYATFRAAYERAKKGEILDLAPVSFPVKKIADHVNANAKPAIVKIEVPETIAVNFTQDPQDYMETSLVCLCTIPSKYIQRIEAL